MEECPICIEIKEIKFKCYECNYRTCIDCMKIYLLNSIKDANCMNCGNMIPYDQFVELFDKKWRLGKYKEYKKKLLYEKEILICPLTLNKIKQERENQIRINNLMEDLKIYRNNIEEKNKEKEEIYVSIRRLKEKIEEIDKEITIINEPLNDVTNEINKLKNKKEYVIYKYNYKCIKEGCRGYLNKIYKCDLCNIQVCSKCLTEKKENHECDEELVLTCTEIKNNAKPCPKCNEFISKIEGCDQMFCILCGTAFSWMTGQIENGIIHNPHAHSFYKRHPNMLLENRCRERIPGYSTIYRIGNHMIRNLHRRVAEFNQYKMQEITTYLLDNNIDLNEDIRKKYLKNELNENQMKKIIFMRYKKMNYKKTELRIIVGCVEILENILWKIYDMYMNSTLSDENLREIIKYLDELEIDTNNNLRHLSDEYGYANSFMVGNSFNNLLYIKI